MSDVIITRATINDIDEIKKLECQYIEEYSINTITSNLLNPNYLNLIVRCDNVVIGYLTATLILDECELLKIIIDNNYRHQGIGKKLLEHLLNLVKGQGCNKILLEVSAENANAIKMYEKSGFVKYGERKKYYKGIDAYLYWYEIC